LGTRKLSEKEGRILKLVSGAMMLGLGTLLLFAPGSLSHLLTAISLIGAAILVFELIVHLDKNLNITR
jgi:hypothetical protein